MRRSKFKKWIEQNPEVKKKYKLHKKLIKHTWNSAIKYAIEKVEYSDYYDAIENIKKLRVK